MEDCLLAEERAVAVLAEQGLSRTSTPQRLWLWLSVCQGQPLVNRLPTNARTSNLKWNLAKTLQKELTLEVVQRSQSLVRTPSTLQLYSKICSRAWVVKWTRPRTSAMQQSWTKAAITSRVISHRSRHRSSLTSNYLCRCWEDQHLCAIKTSSSRTTISSVDPKESATPLDFSWTIPQAQQKETWQVERSRTSYLRWFTQTFRTRARVPSEEAKALRTPSQCLAFLISKALATSSCQRRDLDRQGSRATRNRVHWQRHSSIYLHSSRCHPSQRPRKWWRRTNQASATMHHQTQVSHHKDPSNPQCFSQPHSSDIET